MSQRVPCPDQGRCGHGHHLVSSRAYLLCVTAAQGRSLPTRRPLAPSSSTPRWEGSDGKVLVPDSQGEHYEVTPGVLDADARHVYLNGQCLALACAIADKEDGDVLVVTETMDEADRRLFPELDGQVIQHAYALVDGVLWDADGPHDWDSVVKEDTPHVIGSPEESRLAWEPYVSDQYPAVAESFVDTVLSAEPYVEDARPRYHVTRTSDLEAIMQQGLVPRIGERSAALGEDRPSVYLFSSESDLQDSTWLAEELEDEDVVVLKVRGVASISDHWETVAHGTIHPWRIHVTDIDY